MLFWLDYFVSKKKSFFCWVFIRIHTIQDGWFGYCGSLVPLHQAVIPALPQRPSHPRNLSWEQLGEGQWAACSAPEPRCTHHPFVWEWMALSNYWSRDRGCQPHLQKDQTCKFGAREQIKAKRLIREECGLRTKSPLGVTLWWTQLEKNAVIRTWILQILIKYQIISTEMLGHKYISIIRRDYNNVTNMR